MKFDRERQLFIKFFLPRLDKMWLQEYAQEQGMSVSMVIRKLINQLQLQVRESGLSQVVRQEAIPKKSFGALFGEDEIPEQYKPPVEEEEEVV